MEQLIPKTLRRWEVYQSNLAKAAVLNHFQMMTRGHLKLQIDGDRNAYSFGFGNKVKAEMTIHNERFFTRSLSGGNLAFGESFVDGDWDTPDLFKLLTWFLLNIDNLDGFLRFEAADQPFSQIVQGLQSIQNLIGMSQTRSYGQSIAAQYDLERPFFELMLDSSLSNSSALFFAKDTLELAQLRKQRRITRELRLTPQHHVLELGCGWGSFAIYMALCHQCKVTAVTISEEQHAYLRQRVKELNLGHLITPVHQDYRSIKGNYDRIVSIELIDTLEISSLAGFFDHCESWLKPNGSMVHQMILTPELYRSDLNPHAEWIQKYISPGSTAPSLAQVLAAMNVHSSFCLRNLRDIGSSYAKTLNAWGQRFHETSAAVKSLGFDERFIRSWRYYLAYAQAAFDHGLLTAAQITMTRSTQNLRAEAF